MKNKFEFYTKILNDIGVSVDGEGSCNIRVKDERFFKKALSQGTLGIGEAYVEGWWDCSALDELACRVLKSRVFSKFESLLGKVHAKVRSGINLQTKYKSKEVVDIHYNLGNDFFEKILGTTMIYTCAYWKDSKSLDQAQRNKLELICQKLQLQPSDIVLDIGCGWGGFSKYACENYGCRVVGVNLSEFQVSYAKNFCTNLRADFEVMDYRDRKLRELGPFDKIVSIGMFEHVGPKNYEVFMDIVSQNLKKDGIFVLQTVGSNLRSGNSLWINKYVFPNSVLPLFHEIPKASNSYLVLEDVQNLRSDYDKTLLAWYENLSMIDKLLYDERFFRMWEYYLLTFAGAFRAGDRTQLWQFVFSKSGTNKAYIAPR